jgi:hypothetical protein
VIADIILAPISTEQIFSLKQVETGGSYVPEYPHETDKGSVVSMRRFLENAGVAP